LSIEPLGGFWPTGEDGTLLRISPRLQPPWQGALDAAVDLHRDLLGANLLGVYVRGSVASGEARPGVSDLDLLAVVASEPGAQGRSRLRGALERLREGFPFCAGFDGEVLEREAVLRAPEMAWGRFQIRVLGACVYGEDLAAQLAPFRPDASVIFTAPRLPLAIERARSSLRAHGAKTAEVCRWIAKKIVRAGYDLVLVEEGRFTRDLFPCYSGFADHFPAMEGWMREALSLAIEPSGLPSRVFALLDRLGGWLCSRIVPRPPGAGASLALAPHLKAHLEPGDGLYLFSEGSNHVFRGAEVEALVAAGGLQGALPPGAAAGDASPARSALLARGFLAEDPPDGRERAALWSLQGLPAAEALLRLGAARVALHGLTPALLAPMRAALARAGIAEDEGARLGVVLAEDAIDPRLEGWTREARRQRRPWLLVRPVGSEVWVGPLFPPGGEGCWACMKTRLLQNSSARALLGAGAHVPLPPVPIADFAAGACEIAAREVASWMVLGGRPRLAGVLLSVDVLSWQTRLHRLVPHPRCSICGGRAPRPAEPPALRARGYERRRGWHRIASPRETLARHEHHVSPLLGVVRTLERDPQHEEIHVYHASVNLPPGTSLPQARRVVAGGKGTSEARARASALCEALERYSSFAHGDEAILRGRSRREMGETALDVEATLLFSRRQFEERARWNARGGPWSRVPEPFREDEPLDWCALWSLSRGEVRYAPTALCLGGHLPGRAMLPWDSSGCASGNCLEEAALHGLLELIERDGTAIWWYNRLPRAGVDLASFADPWLASVEQWLSEEGRRLWALDLSFDLGIPSFGAFSDHQGGPVVFGFGAHTSPRLALRRAVSEMLQFLVVEEVALRRVPSTPEQAAMRRWLEEVRCEDEPWLRPCPGLPQVKGGAMLDLSTGDILEDFSLCRRRVEAVGCEVFWMDLTRPDVRLPTVRVVVPGLRSVRRRLAPGRLYDVPVSAGLLPEAIDETRVNPLDFILLPPRLRGSTPMDTIYITDIHGNLGAIQRALAKAREHSAVRRLVLGGDVAPNRVGLRLLDGDFPLRHEARYDPEIAAELRRCLRERRPYRPEDQHGKPAVFHEITATSEELSRLDDAALRSVLGGPSSFEYLRERQLQFVEGELLPLLGELRQGGIESLVMLGNDDFVELEAPLLAAEARGELGYLHGRVRQAGASVVAGYSCVTSKPFRYRAWERSEEQIAEDLRELLAGLEPSRTILAIHVPPYGTALDRLGDGRHVGSRAVRSLLEGQRFALGLFGHVHESPWVSGARLDRVQGTTIFNPGGLHERDCCALLLDAEEPGRWLGLWGLSHGAGWCWLTRGFRAAGARRGRPRPPRREAPRSARRRPARSPGGRPPG
jgi:ribosomal protein S12 methylthiotransferase accessory factor